MQRSNPYIAIVLALYPGLNHLYIGQPRKAIGLLIISTGIFLTFFLSPSLVMKLLMTGMYNVTFWPSCIEGYQIARYGRQTLDTDAKWYIVILLLCTGFTALPMLWQSPKFTRAGKIAWSIAVPILAITFFTCLLQYWQPFEQYLNDILR